MKQTSIVVVAILVFFLALWGLRSGEPPRPDVPWLASNAYFKVAGQPVVIPVVAVAQPGSTFSLGGGRSGRFISEVSGIDPEHPRLRDQLSVSIREYNYRGEWVDAVEICPLLKRKWS